MVKEILTVITVRDTWRVLDAQIAKAQSIEADKLILIHE